MCVCVLLLLLLFVLTKNTKILLLGNTTIKTKIIRHHSIPNSTVLKRWNQKYEYVAVQKYLHIYLLFGYRVSYLFGMYLF